MDLLLSIVALTLMGVSIVGWLWITVNAFSEGETLWGVGCLIISPLCLVYGFFNLEELKVPFLMVLVGFVARLGIGFLVM